MSKMYISLGLMSGTSMDGIDGVIIETNGEDIAKNICSLSLDYQENFRILLRIVEYTIQKNEGDIISSSKYFSGCLEEYLDALNIYHKLPELENYLGSNEITMEKIIDKLTDLHIVVIEDLLKKANLVKEKISVIGVHGQNFYHNPEKKITIQLCDAEKIAEKIGIIVVNDFRSKDVKNNGQGAPLAPIYHLLIARNLAIYPCLLINCGGIANISYIKSNDKKSILGFDTGPGNILIDKFVRTRTLSKEFMDKDGKYARKGKLDQKIIEELYRKSCKKNLNNYYDAKPPKSLDSKNLELPEIFRDITIEDGCANLSYFTAKTILDSLDLVENLIVPEIIILAGGGWNNPTIKENLENYAYLKFSKKIKIKNADELGWSNKYMEAELFAFLAVCSILEISTSFPWTTGVDREIVGGTKTKPQKL